MENIKTGLRLKQTIGFRLMAIVFSIYFAVTMTLTIANVVLSFNNEKKALKAHLVELANVFKRGVSVALWNSDEIQIGSIVDGIIQIPLITGVEIEDLYDELKISKGAVTNSDSDERSG